MSRRVDHYADRRESEPAASTSAPLRAFDAHRVGKYLQTGTGEYAGHIDGLDAAIERGAERVFAQLTDESMDAMSDPELDAGIAFVKAYERAENAGDYAAMDAALATFDAEMERARSAEHPEHDPSYEVHTRSAGVIDLTWATAKQQDAVYELTARDRVAHDLTEYERHRLVELAGEIRERELRGARRRSPDSVLARVKASEVVVPEREPVSTPVVDTGALSPLPDNVIELRPERPVRLPRRRAGIDKGKQATDPRSWRALKDRENAVRPETY